MHEFSIAVNIVDIAATTAEQNGAKSVGVIELEVGTLSGVVTEALDLAMKSAIKETICEHASVIIDEIQGKGYCKSCKADFELENIFDPCPECGTFNPEITAGKELKIKSIIVD